MQATNLTGSAEDKLMMSEAARCHVQSAGPAEVINHLNLELCHCIDQTGIALMQLTQLILSFLCHNTMFAVLLYVQRALHVEDVMHVWGGWWRRGGGTRTMLSATLLYRKQNKTACMLH